MKNSPVVGIFLGIIIVLLIVIFSLGYQVNKSYKLYHKETTRRIGTEEEIAEVSERLRLSEKQLKQLNTELKEERELVFFKNTQIDDLDLELRKLNKLKYSLEESLKQALIDNDTANP